MKSYSIGRDESCNIIVHDTTKMVSRRHATLNVDGSKITIVDDSTNGTYINGIRISSGVPVPVTRKDVVSFAQIAELDWKCVPDTSRKITGIIVAILTAMVVIGSGSYYYFSKDKEKEEEKIEEQTVAWAQLGEKINAMKKDIATIVADHKSIAGNLEDLKKKLSTKEVSENKAAANAENVKKIFWQVEEALNKVDPEDLQKSLDSVVQSYDDKVSSTESRTAELEKKVKGNKEELDNAAKYIKEATASIASLKTKTKPQPKTKVEEQEDKTKDVIIVGM